MAKLGTSKRPAIARVQTMERAEEILALCERHGWKVVVGIEPDKPEDISDAERLLNPQAPVTVQAKVGRNDPCPCGSGLKYKHCCLKKHNQG
jgi:SWIM/SEC-C metal-binding protein